MLVGLVSIMDLTELYFKVFPKHDGSDLHFFFRAHGIGICISDKDREDNEAGKKKATSYLMGKLWEQQTGEKLS